MWDVVLMKKTIEKTKKKNQNTGSNPYPLGIYLKHLPTKLIKMACLWGSLKIFIILYKFFLRNPISAAVHWNYRSRVWPPSFLSLGLSCPTGGWVGSSSSTMGHLCPLVSLDWPLGKGWFLKKKKKKLAKGGRCRVWPSRSGCRHIVLGWALVLGHTSSLAGL